MLQNDNGKLFAESTNIKVFPSAYRSVETNDATFGAESKLMTEFNLTHNGVILHENDSYIIKIVEDSQNNTFDLDFVIGGYYFKLIGITSADLTQIDNNHNYIYIGLREDVQVASDQTTTILKNMTTNGDDYSQDCTINSVKVFGGLCFAAENYAPNYPTICLKLRNATYHEWCYENMIANIHHGHSDISGNLVNNIEFGDSVEARHANSIAFGNHTKTSSENQLVFGKYNKSSGTSGYLELVGNGSTNGSTVTRSNARTLTENGDEWLSGKLTTEGQIITKASLKTDTIYGYSNSSGSEVSIVTNPNSITCNSAGISLSTSLIPDCPIDLLSNYINLKSPWGAANNDYISIKPFNKQILGIDTTSNITPLEFYSTNATGVTKNTAIAFSVNDYSNSKVSALKITGKNGVFGPNALIQYDGQISNDLGGGNASFTVTQNGAIYATNIQISGDISTTTGSITVSSGNITATNGYISSGNYIEAPYFNATSDVRLKENIEEFKYTKSILDLPIKTFNFIGKEEKQIGCLAQDLQKIYPELVHENEAGYLSIQESKLVYLLLEEVKKLKEEIKNIEGK